MESMADGDDDEDMFDLSSDDDGVEEQEEDGEGAMMAAEPPYDPDDWDMLMVGGAAEAGEEYTGIIGDDAHDDDDIHSLMDNGLEEVDDILRKQGRLGLAGSNPLPVNVDPPLTATCSTTDSGGPAPESERRQRRNSSRSSVAWKETVLEADNQSARGTDAQAATTLSKNAERLPRCASGRSTNRAINYPSRTDSILDVHKNNSAPKSTDAEAVSLLASSTRRRAKKEQPFIQANGLTLTYTQAKLFGLAGPAFPGPPPCPSSQGDPFCSSAVPLEKVLQATRASALATTTWQGRGGQGEREGRKQTSNFDAAATAGRRSTTDKRNVASIARTAAATYCTSRMEDLARPIPGRGRVGSAGDGFLGGNTGLLATGGERANGAKSGDASFTWKRSRRAEAAMRDPACGYDFVRDQGGLQDSKGFLDRMQAYSSYSRVKLETRRAEEEYDTRLDKLQCPRCGNPQSYDEFSTKKIRCPGCDVPYYMPKTWNRRVWEQRNEACAMKSMNRQARLEQETEEELLRSKSRQTRHAALLRQRVGQVGFMARMRRDLHRRRAYEGENYNSRRSNNNENKIGDQHQRRASSAGTDQQLPLPRPSSVATTSHLRAMSNTGVTTSQMPIMKSRAVRPTSAPPLRRSIRPNRRPM